MANKLINATMLTAAVALGGTALAQTTGGATNPPTAAPQQTAQGQAMAPNVKSVRLTSLDKNQIKDVQKQLKDVGFYKGDVDGVLGAGTKSALLAYFQHQIMLAQQGRISDDSLLAFGFAKTDIEKVRGVDEAKGSERESTQGHEAPATPQQKSQMQQQQPQQEQPKK